MLILEMVGLLESRQAVNPQGGPADQCAPAAFQECKASGLGRGGET